MIAASDFESFIDAFTGASDAGPCARHVHPVRDRCVSGPDDVHEELGCQPTRQEIKETTGFYLPHQKRGTDKM